METAIPLMPPRMVLNLTSISRKLIDCKDPVVSEIWSTVFLSCLKFVPLEAIVDQV